MLRIQPKQGGRTAFYSRTFSCCYGVALAVHVAALVDIKMLRRSLVTSIPICRIVRKELKDSSDSLSASRSWTASVRIFSNSRQASSNGCSEFNSCTELINATTRLLY